MGLTVNTENAKRVRGASRITADFARKLVEPGGEFDVYSPEDIASLGRITKPENFFYMEAEMPNGKSVFIASDGTKWHDATSLDHAKSISNFDEEGPKLAKAHEEHLAAKTKRKSRQLMVLEEKGIAGTDPDKVAALEQKIKELESENKKQKETLKNNENLRSEFEDLKKTVEGLTTDPKGGNKK